jgi:hypothetical protein
MHRDDNRRTRRVLQNEVRTCLTSFRVSFGAEETHYFAGVRYDLPHIRTAKRRLLVIG